VTWHFHLQEVPSGDWIDRDFPLADAFVVEPVSAPAAISGTIPLGYPQRARIKEWGCLLVAEEDGRDPVVAIVDSIATEGDNLHIDAGGYSMYPTGMPWVDAEYSGTSVDPMDVVRMIWAKLQARPSGNLGVVLDADKSPVRLGIPERADRTKAKAILADAKAREATAKTASENAAKDLNTAKISLLAAASRPSAGIVLYQDSAPSGDSRTAANLWIDKNDANKGYIWDGKKWALQTTSSQAIINTRLATWTAAKASVEATGKTYTTRKTERATANSKLSAIEGGDAEPYQINWWDTHDLGAVIDDLAKSTPFDYREVSRWVDDNTLGLRLELGVPSLGVRRTDLRFEIGVNATAAPPVQERDYSSEVIVLGAGEGRAMVRATTTGNAGRLRRATVISRKDIGKTDTAASVARVELAARKAEWVFDSLDVIDHPMARYGSYRAGDEIYTTGDAGWIQLDHWVRVLEISTDCTSGAISLKVEVT
jgi:hypothetical protein